MLEYYVDRIAGLRIEASVRARTMYRAKRLCDERRIFDLPNYFSDYNLQMSVLYDGEFIAVGRNKLTLAEQIIARDIRVHHHHPEPLNEQQKRMMGDLKLLLG